MRRLVCAFAVSACATARPASEPDPPPPGATAVSSAPDTATGRAADTASGPAAPPSAPAPPSCGALGCRLFDDPIGAFEYVLRSRPRVLAVGESHVRKDAEGVRSATARFTEELLPPLRGRAAALIVELMLPPSGCHTETETVREQQREVTEEQSTGNQNEFVVLGQRARALGIVPYPLRPSCEDLAKVSAAGDEAIFEMLAAIARLSTRSALDLLADLDRKNSDRMVVLYGGALHNDLDPEPGREAWSFGPELSRAVGDRYVAIDLIVPELIRDTDTWRKLPWYSHYDAGAHPEKVTLFELTPRSYVLVFARSTGSGSAGKGAEG